MSEYPEGQMQILLSGATKFLEKIEDDKSKFVLDSVDQYEKITKIGQGTYGEVFKVRQKASKKNFALKRIKLENEKEGVIFFLCFFNPHIFSVLIRI